MRRAHRHRAGSSSYIYTTCVIYLYADDVCLYSTVLNQIRRVASEQFIVMAGSVFHFRQPFATHGRTSPNTRVQCACAPNALNFCADLLCFLLHLRLLTLRHRTQINVSFWSHTVVSDSKAKLLRVINNVLSPVLARPQCTRTNEHKRMLHTYINAHLHIYHLYSTL